MLSVLSDFLIEKDVEYTVGISMSDISPIGIGGLAQLYAVPSTKEKLVDLIDLIEKNKIEYTLVGGMSNLLPQDNEYQGVIISTKGIKKIVFDKENVNADAGVYLPRLIKEAGARSLGGMEALSGIPGTVGGALVSNAGAFGTSISDFLICAEFLDPKRESIVTLYKDQLEFSYRRSIVKSRGLLALNATFRLESIKKEEIRNRIKRFRDMRAAAQPIGERSLGSVFKRFCGVGAGYYIDACGLKGLRVGGAQISQKHAGFIVNSGGATASDYLALVDVARRRVKEKFGLELELEIEVMGSAK